MTFQQLCKCAVMHSDRFVPHGHSPLAPFPSGVLDEENAIDVRAASTGGMVDEKEPLVLTTMTLHVH